MILGVFADVNLLLLVYIILDIEMHIIYLLFNLMFGFTLLFDISAH